MRRKISKTPNWIYAALLALAMLAAFWATAGPAECVGNCPGYACQSSLACHGCGCSIPIGQVWGRCR